MCLDELLQLIFSTIIVLTCTFSGAVTTFKLLLNKDRSKVWLNDVNCYGTEDGLFNCRLRYSYYCNYRTYRYVYGYYYTYNYEEAAGVRCPVGKYATIGNKLSIKFLLLQLDIEL